MSHSPPAIGIDLGTTNTVMAYVQADGSWMCIPNQEGQEHTPSVVQITEQGFSVGQAALDNAETHPSTVIQEVKRHMGDPDWAWVVDGIVLQPQDISALLLQKVQQDASLRLGQEVRSAVISVPAHFSENQRQATMEAARLAGLEPLRLLNEPSAAALAYGYQDIPEGSLLFVMDLGGGTFDVSVLQYNKDNLLVLSTRGHAHLGGQDWDDLLLHQAAAQFISEHGQDPLDDPHSHQRLKRKVITAKHQLSFDKQVTLSIQHQQLVTRVTITQEQFKQMARSKIGQMHDLCRLALEDRSATSIARVLLVGGATKMPMIQQLAATLFPQAPIVQDYPEKAVAYGAALQASLLQQGRRSLPTKKVQQGRGSLLTRKQGPPSSQRPLKEQEADHSTDPLPEKAPVEAQGVDHSASEAATNKEDIERPKSGIRSSTPDIECPESGVRNSTLDERPESVRREQPLYLGGKVSQEQSDVIPIRLGVRDVNSHRLGLVVLDAQGRPLVDTLIEQFSPLPYTYRATYYTAHRNQISLELDIVEGESPYPEECIPLGKATITDIPPRPAGQAIEVEFTYNRSGLLQLSVQDIGTGRQYHQHIQSPHQHPKGAKERIKQWLKKRQR